MTDHDTTTTTERPEFGSPAWADELKLRPTEYRCDEPHPDPSPCPAWCWAYQSGQKHLVDARAGDVHHHSESAQLRASLYRGGPSITDDTIEVFATHEARLEREGQREVQVVVARRTKTQGQSEYEDDLLKLTVEDARELGRRADPVGCDGGGKVSNQAAPPRDADQAAITEWNRAGRRRGLRPRTLEGRRKVLGGVSRFRSSSAATAR